MNNDTPSQTGDKNIVEQFSIQLPQSNIRLFSGSY